MLASQLRAFVRRAAKLILIIMGRTGTSFFKTYWDFDSLATGTLGRGGEGRRCQGDSEKGSPRSYASNETPVGGSGRFSGRRLRLILLAKIAFRILPRTNPEQERLEQASNCL